MNRATEREKAEIKQFFAVRKAKSFAKNKELIRQAKQELRVIYSKENQK